VSDGKRRYLPGEAYRFLVLAALEHRRGVPATKGEIAWETRANHYMLTRVLRELRDAGHLAIEQAGDGYAIRLTPEGQRFLDDHRAYAAATFRAALAEHFRYGAPPAWSRGWLAS
jgi:predicted transcriptional regulator